MRSEPVDVVLVSPSGRHRRREEQVVTIRAGLGNCFSSPNLNA